MLVFIDADDGTTGIGVSLGQPSAEEAIVTESLGSLIIDDNPWDTTRCWEKMYSGSQRPSSIERGYSQPQKDG